MSNIVISAKNLSKIYRLYDKPKYRVLDMMKLLPTRKNKTYFREYAALQNINIDIYRGEKVALIGRNGAGKSTLLKLITKVISPSSGTLEVRSKTQALLQIGTGFYPEFTGRQNVMSYLAHLGITGNEAKNKLAEIVEFSELEIYIDQPVKTYSTGMSMRLMFAASTVMQPDILVIDEVLSVGDAYFSKKSFNRIEQLCSNQGTTLLLVSHDIYSAAKLCDRMIWIDHGKILLDTHPVKAIKAYEDSIRIQEEERLRTKRKSVLADQKSKNCVPLTLEIKTKEGRPVPAIIYFSEIAILQNEMVLAKIPKDNAQGYSIDLIREGTCWGEETEFDKKTVLPMLNYDSVFHKVAITFWIPKEIVFGKEQKFTFQLETYTQAETELLGQVDWAENKLSLKLDNLNIKKDTWQQHKLQFDLNKNENISDKTLNTPNLSGIHGSGAIEITEVKLLNEHGIELNEIVHGQPIIFLIEYCIRKPNFLECPDICIAIFRRGTRECICRYLVRDLLLDASKKKTGVIKAKINRTIIGTGEFTASFFIAEHEYLAKQQTLFYSLNPKVYLSLPDVLEFKVTSDLLLASNTAFVGDSEWCFAD